MVLPPGIQAIVQGPCTTSERHSHRVSVSSSPFAFCAGKALPILRKKPSKRGAALGMVFVTQTSPTSVALHQMLFCYVDGSGDAQGGQQFELMAEVVLLPEEGERITCVSLTRHDSKGITGFLLWIGTSNGTLLVVNAAPGASPSNGGGAAARIVLVCQLHQKAPSRNAKHFSVDQGHEAIVSICASTAGSPSLRNPWLISGEGVPLSNNGAVHTRCVDVLHQSGWLVSFDEEQIETLLESSTPSVASTSGVTDRPIRLSLAKEWRQTQDVPHAAASSNTSTSSAAGIIPAACISNSVRECMKRCVGHLLMPIPHAPHNELGTTAAASALLHAPGTSALDVLETSVSVKSQRLIVVSGVGEHGPGITFYSVHIRPEAALSAKSAALEVAGRITGAAIRAVKGFWGRRSEPEEPAAVIHHAAVTRPQHSTTPIPSASVIDGTTIKAHSIVVSPTSHYAAVVASNTDRIIILDLVMGTVCRILKGCRQCDVQWVECPTPFRYGRRSGTSASSDHFLIAVYHKIRGVVEYYSMRDAQRVTACKVEAGLQLLRVEGVEPLSELLLITPDQSRLYSARLEIQEAAPADRLGTVAGSAGAVDDALSLHESVMRQLEDIVVPPGQAERDRVGITDSLLSVLRRCCEQQQGRWEYRLKHVASSPRALEKLRDDIQADLFSCHSAVLDHKAVNDAPVPDVADCVRLLLRLWAAFLGVPLPHEVHATTSHSTPSSPSGQAPLKTRAQQYHHIDLKVEALDLFCSLLEPIEEGQLKSTLAGDVGKAEDTAPSVSYWGASLLSTITFTRSDDTASAAPQLLLPEEAMAKLIGKAARVGDGTIHALVNGTHWWRKASNRLLQWCADHARTPAPPPSSNTQSEAPPEVPLVLPSIQALMRCFDYSGATLSLRPQYHDVLVKGVMSDIIVANTSSVCVDLIALAHVCFGSARHTSLASVLERQAPILAKLGIVGPSASLLLLVSLLHRSGGGNNASTFYGICFDRQCQPVAVTTAKGEGGQFLQLSAGLRLSNLPSLVAGAALLPHLLVREADSGTLTAASLDGLIERAALLLLATASVPSAPQHVATPKEQSTVTLSVQWIMRLVALEEYLRDQPMLLPAECQRAWMRCGGMRSDTRLFAIPPQLISLGLDGALKTQLSGTPTTFIKLSALRNTYDNLSITSNGLEHRLKLQRAIHWSCSISSPQLSASRWCVAPQLEDAACTPRLWDTDDFNLVGRDVVASTFTPERVLVPAQVLREVAAALHLASTVLIPIRPVVSQDTVSWKEQRAPDRHDFASKCASFQQTVEHGGQQWASLIALGKTVSATLRDKMYEALQGALLTTPDADPSVVMQTLLEADTCELYGLDAGSASSPSTASRTLLPLATPDEVSALQNLSQFLGYHQFAADAVYMALNDVHSLVSFLEWCLVRSIGSSLRNSDVLGRVPWTDMFAVPSFQLLHESAVYPALDVTHHAMMAEQRSRARLAFLCQATGLAVKAIAPTPGLGADGLSHFASDIRTFACSLSEVLQQDALLATGAADCAVIAHVLRNCPIGDSHVNLFLRGITTQSSLRYPCAATILIHVRRYIYTCIKWYASLEKGISPADKEARTRHSSGSVKLRSSMSTEFQTWLRSKTAASDAVPAAEDAFHHYGTAGGQNLPDDDVVVGRAFYNLSDTDVAVDAHVRQSIGQGRLRQMLSGLRFVAELLMTTAQEFRHDDRGSVGFDAALSELDRVTAVVEQVLLEGVALQVRK